MDIRKLHLLWNEAFLFSYTVLHWHTNAVWSATVVRVIGTTPRKIVKYLGRWIALSTCMWTAAILLVFVLAFVERDLPFAKGRMFNVAFFFVTISLILIPLWSAITSSRGSSLSISPDFWVIFRSEIPSEQRLETNVKAPEGEIHLWLVITSGNFLS